MANTRQQIMDALEARLKSISTANGYGSNLGGSVHTWRKRPVTLADTPCLLVADGSADSTSLAYPVRDHRLSVDIVGVVSSNTTASQARQLADDIHAAIGADQTLGGLALKIDPLSHEITLETDGDITGAVKVSISIHYRTALWRI